MNQHSKKKIIPAYSGFQLEGPKPRINEFKFALQIFFEFIKDSEHSTLLDPV